MSAPDERVDVLAVMDGACAILSAANTRVAESELRRARAAVAELIEVSRRFGQLFEAWNREGDNSVPLSLQGTTENEVVDAMYEMRAALARIGGAK